MRQSPHWLNLTALALHDRARTVSPLDSLGSAALGAGRFGYSAHVSYEYGPVLWYLPVSAVHTAVRHSIR